MKRTVKRATTARKAKFIEVFERYITEKEINNISKETLKSYQITMYRKFIPYFSIGEDTNLEDVVVKEVWFQFKAHLHNDELSLSSQQHYLRDIRTFFNYCFEYEGIEPFKMEMPKGQEASPKAFSEDDIQVLVQKPRANADFFEWRTWAMVCYILATGNRIGSVVEIQMEDVNLTQKTVVLKHTKNKDAQVSLLTDASVRALREYISIWRSDAGSKDYLFCNGGEGQLTTNASRQAFETYCKNRGVAQHNLHGLRHTYALSYIRNGGGQYQLQRILGHKTASMTQHYVKLVQADIAKDIEEYSALDNILRSSNRTIRVKRRK